MTAFLLELYFENDEDRALIEDARVGLTDLVNGLAPHVRLEVLTLRVSHTVRCVFVANGTRRDVPNHNPSASDRQALLITNEQIGAEGWAGSGRGVVSKAAMEVKAKLGGNPADILIHEWLHTIEGAIINGRSVPYVDDAERMGFSPERRPDGQITWYNWYRFVLGGTTSI